MTELLSQLRARFLAHPARHADLTWTEVEVCLRAHPVALSALEQMEQSGGEPDVIGRDDAGALRFVDCAAESPAGRRSACYDGEARLNRKENAPARSAVEWATEIGARLLTEAEYRHLQTLGAFDQKTSSWLATPQDVRALGGALFGDRRYGRVFTYHNGAQSYYAARGFRVLLCVQAAR